MRPFPLILFLLAHLALSASAQHDPDKLLSDAIDHRFVSLCDTLFSFYAIRQDAPVKADADKTYYWFSKDSIFTTKGGYAGRLLHGEYKVFYPDKSLRESGYFRYGLKDGTWKTWYPDGSAESVSYWKNGKMKGSPTVSDTKDDD